VESAGSEPVRFQCTAGCFENPCQNPSATKIAKGARRRPRARRSLHDSGRATKIPHAAQHDHGQGPRISVPSGGERGVELAQVAHKDGGIDRHVEDAGRKREPALLVAPERAHGAPHPGVEAAFGGDGAGQLANHQGRGQAPENRKGQEDDDGPGVASSAQDVLNAVGATRHHKVCGGDERQEAHLSRGGLRAKSIS